MSLDLNLKAKDIREMSDEDISRMVFEAREHLMRLRFQKVTGEVQDTSEFRKTKRLIARLLTVLRERELQAERETSQEGGREA